MSLPLPTVIHAPSPAARAVDPASVSALQARIRAMQRDRWEAQGRSVSPGLATLLPGGTLRTGTVYTVENSTSLIMAMLGSATVDGAWSAVVGLPNFGAEAATGFGIDLARLVLVPTPGDQWLAVTAALVDVLPLVVVRPQRRVGDADASRLSARLRQTGCTLIVAGAWAQSEAALRITATRWAGLGSGHGYLSGRELSVEVLGRNGSPGPNGRAARLRLPETPLPTDAHSPGLAALAGPPRAASRPRPATG